jgi:hypothetical protein
MRACPFRLALLFFIRFLGLLNVREVGVDEVKIVDVIR